MILAATPSFHYCIEQRKGSPEYQQLHKNSAGVRVIVTRRVKLNAGCIEHVFRVEHDAIEAFAAVLSGLFSFVLTFSTVLLWKETKRLAAGAETQSKDMKDSIAEATRSADAMCDSASSMRDFSYAARRTAEISEFTAKVTMGVELPILHPEAIAISAQGTRTHNEWIKALYPEVTIRNYGKTPAIIDAVIINVLIGDTLPTVPHYQRTTEHPEPLIIAANSATEYKEYLLEYTDAMSDENIARFSDPNAALFLLGKIEFRDFLDLKHERGFVFMFVRKTKRVVSMSTVYSEYDYQRRKEAGENYSQDTQPSNRIETT